MPMVVYMYMHMHMQRHRMDLAMTTGKLADLLDQKVAPHQPLSRWELHPTGRGLARL